MNPSELIASLRAESDELIKYQFSHTKEAMSCLQRLHDLSLEAADALQAMERVPMTEEADELLRKWNLDPDLYRTDSGALNHMKIAAALKHPDDYPHTAQTAVKSESLAQAAQALARLPSEGKTIEALAPTEAALRDVVRQSEDLGLYDADFQIGAQEREDFEAHWYNFYHAGHISADVDGKYRSSDVQKSWNAWKARAGRKG